MALAGLFLSVAGVTSARTITLDDRVRAQTAIERVYWSHRIWPAENPDPKPSLEEVMPEAAIRAKVERLLRASREWEISSGQHITPGDLQAEMERMARDSRGPALLEEVFAALGNDPFLIAECLARQTLTARGSTAPRARARDIDADDAPDAYEGRSEAAEERTSSAPIDSGAIGAPDDYQIVAASAGICEDDTWLPTSLDASPFYRTSASAVWTGAEMIVWGGYSEITPESGALGSGGRYDPSTDTWVPTIEGEHAPMARVGHSAVWTGTEMIVWGGYNEAQGDLDAGARYNPMLDSWHPTAIDPRTPYARSQHFAFWTGRTMLVWGGETAVGDAGIVGGQYNPKTDRWTRTRTYRAPHSLLASSAIWTGREMIVWGGEDYPSVTNAGARYNPRKNRWKPIGSQGAPQPRRAHAAVWTGSEMIVWGGYAGLNAGFSLNDGARYDPRRNTWKAISTFGAPEARSIPSAVWTGAEMIVWGGAPWGSGGSLSDFDNGGRYDPATDTWRPTSSVAGVLLGRVGHSAVWTGGEMIVWGGVNSTDGPTTLYFRDGARYCASGH